jgi:hypothetical protein
MLGETNITCVNDHSSIIIWKSLQKFEINCISVELKPSFSEIPCISIVTIDLNVDRDEGNGWDLRNFGFGTDYRSRKF